MLKLKLNLSTRSSRAAATVSGPRAAAATRQRTPRAMNIASTRPRDLTRLEMDNETTPDLV